MFDIKPIGTFRCAHDYHQEQPMQGVLSEADGYIELEKGFNYEQGLKDLNGFEYIWVLFVFHLNRNWKPLTNPPYSDGKGKKGVFATRSPYRPNPVGMSCVRLDRVDGNRVYISGSDLLNNTPVIDIKPYIADFDSFPTARRGWLDNVVKDAFAVVYEDSAAAKAAYLKRHGVDLRGVINSQLSHNPHDQTRNKYIKSAEGLMLRFKSWRVLFNVAEKTVIIKDIRSGYTSFASLLGNDTAADIRVHQLFARHFKQLIRPPDCTDSSDRAE
ncbi:MAG: tRNA (N6-threonylcarbamoyladenosine(37)-N6)-methyltransferase TrmO [Candidatus Riflebacteria bacterium HGW-Riflebacteria-1]|jgi:tRNA-Thr(GGU) m(6)t(6)A37 methyltransferase TsaA|nr:MAG: tRNA (N6-threonylcarbamoyladenosine(37)-N6)-methyltransferase TrmO [Candidatus Riflebacteria bacterium HGW-Riflebacteria-1]